MKKASKLISFVMAVLIAASAFAVTAFAEGKAYAHPEGVFTLEGGESKDKATLVAVGEMVYSSITGSDSVCYKVYCPAKTDMAFSFNAAAPIDVSISQLDSAVSTNLSGNSVYNTTVSLENAYYYITVKNYVAPPQEPETPEAPAAESSEIQLMSGKEANDFFFTTSIAGMPAKVTVDINTRSVDLVSGETTQLKLSACSVDDLNYFWRVIDDPETSLVNEKDIVTVTKDGLVKVMPNSATFNKDTTVKVQAVMYYNGEEWTKTCTIKAIPANVFLTPYFDHTGNNNLVMGVGASRTVQATTNIKDGVITWESADPEIAAVEKGKITAKAVGKTTVTVTATAPSGQTASRYIAVEVKENYVSVTGAKFNEHSGSVRVGDSLNLKPTITTSPEDRLLNENVTIEYVSANPEIATVDKDGKVTGVAVGTTRITVTVKDGKYEFVDAYELTVKEKLPNWLMVIIAPIRVIYNLVVLIINAVKGK